MLPRSHYDALQVKQSASVEEIKRSYQRLLLAHHPDKGASDDDEFIRIQEAWQVLKNDAARAAYDKAMAQLRLAVQKELHAHQLVVAADMAWDEATGALSSPCRCGGAFALSRDDLEQGVTIVGCTSCSMKAFVEL